MNEAEIEEHIAIRTALLGMASGWTTLAYQMDRLHDLRADRPVPKAGHG
jgi:hypothetical protein